MNKLSRLPFGTTSRSGFTLLELLIVLAIVGILAAIAGPSLVNTIESSRVVSVRDSMANAIKTARSSAVYNKNPVSICTSSNQATCSGSTDWSQGWVIFNDFNGLGSIDGADDLIDVFYGESSLTITGLSVMTFASSGLRTDGGGNQTFSVNSSNTSVASKGVTVSVTGAISYQ